MAFNVNKIRSQLNQSKGVLNSSHFFVQITPPQWMKNVGENNFMRSIPFLCSATSLPGMRFNSSDYRPYGMGMIEKRPYYAAVEDVRLRFYCDAEGFAIKFFHEWLQNVNNFNVTGNNSEMNGLGTYVFQYPDLYQTTVDINVLDPTNKPVTKYTLFNAYPIEVQDIDVDWSNTDSGSLMMLSVLMTYRNWKTEAIKDGKPFVSEGEIINNEAITALGRE